jgi:O-antigen/teichoic acid export membrane protein
MTALRSELSNPLFRNAYALMVNGGLTGVLGLGYWLLAARVYDPEQVGRQSAQNQAMMFLGGLTALNFILIRFIPEMGRRTGALALRTYVAGGVAAGTLAVGFLLTLRWWGPSFSHLGSPARGAFFVVAVVSWSLFTAQDGVLTGLRRATWVLGKNATFAALKVVLLVALAVALPRDGITTSWTLSALVLLVPVEVLLRRRLIPRHVEESSADRPIPSGGQIGRYLAGDYTGTLFYYALCNLVPVVVATRLDASTNAYFYVAWVLGATVDVLAINMAMSLTVEGAFDANGLAAACRSVLTRMALILAPITLVILVGAHAGLSIFGSEYARHGAPLLRLLALATLPKALIEVFIGVLRVQRRARLIALLQGVRFAGVLVLVLTLAHGSGVTGPGYAVLAVSAAMGVAILPALLRVTRRPGNAAGAEAEPAEPADGTIDTDGTIDANGANGTESANGAFGTTGAVSADGAEPLDGEGGRSPIPAVEDSSSSAGVVRIPIPRTEADPDEHEPTHDDDAASVRASEDGRPAEPSRPIGRRDRWGAALVWGLFAVALALYWLPLRHVDMRHMNGYGLVSVLPVATLVGGGLLVVAFMATLWLRRPHRALLLLQLVAIIVSLHGLAPALEAYARPETAWQHNGFVEYIARTGAADYALDARFSWPGFFALTAFLSRAAGVHNLEPIMHWTPVISQLLYLAPMYLILRALRANWRAQWLAAWLFVAADWVGQDYFSPQGFGYLLYLLFIGILLNWFRPGLHPVAWAARSGRMRTFLLGPLTAGERPPPQTSAGERTALLSLLVVLFAVATASHQLTPFLILFVCAALVVVGRSTVRGLPILLGVIVASWVGFMTTAYWAGHASDLFSGVGALLSNLTGGVAGRVSKGSESLATVQAGRILIAGTVMILALAGATRRRLRRIDDRVALVLLVVPFLAAGLQNYGGEIALRVYFFVIPGACVLVAYLFFPTTFTAARRTWAVCAAGLCALIIAGGFLFVRFGNETFEQVKPGDVRAFDTMLRTAPHQMIDVVWLADPQDDAGYFPMMPWGSRRMEQFDYTAVRAPSDPANLSGVLQALRDKPSGYFVTTRGNEAYNHYNYGLPASYGPRLRASLASSAALRPVAVNDEAAIYALREPPDGTAPPPVRAAHFSFRHTTWTPIGLITVPLLIVLLVAREVLRVRRRPDETSRTRLLTGASYVLVILLAFVIIERFVALGG